MNCYDFKGGNGTASRLVRYGRHTFTVAAFVQANFGSRHELTVAGRHVGPQLAEDNPLAGDWFERDMTRPPPGAGSVIAVVATDAPLLPGQCKALARRVPLGLARTGTTGSHFSGDIFLAFSTAPVPDLASRFPVGDPGDDEFGHLKFLPWGRMDDFYAAVVHSVEEAVLNALVVNADMVGRDGHRSPALPHGPAAGAAVTSETQLRYGARLSEVDLCRRVGDRGDQPGAERAGVVEQRSGADGDTVADQVRITLHTNVFRVR